MRDCVVFHVKRAVKLRSILAHGTLELRPLDSKSRKKAICLWYLQCEVVVMSIPQQKKIISGNTENNLDMD
ncbi:hypothetical protein CHELA20_40011 [Hyphomicrobiales bacterium]|nr:hypothetical protein CHELA20_40011 [Hyphomicrobiales bacterium]CAH1687420.1 hypothetical protein CHELA41_40011 [Hyphomicrobiales bacterium]